MSLVRFRFWAFATHARVVEWYYVSLPRRRSRVRFPSRALKDKKRSLILQASFLYDDLLANWDLLEKGEKTFTIEPLK